MAKKLTVKVDEYTKDGQTKGVYRDIGVLMDGENGQYILMDPDFNPAGMLMRQNTMNMKAGRQRNERIMVSLFEQNRS